MSSPTAPSADECSATALKTSAKPDDLVPRAGIYSYKVEGSRQLIGAGGFTKNLPSRSTFLITPVRSFGNIRCFTVQRRLVESLADTATFAVRGGDVYLTKLDLQSGGHFTSIQPSPPAISFNGSETDWSGSFRGPTSARYRGEVIGRKTIRVGARRVRAVGFESRFAFAGEFKGTEKSVRWVSLSDNLVLMEQVSQRREFGLDKIRLSYTARLVSRPDRND